MFYEKDIDFYCSVYFFVIYTKYQFSPLPVIFVLISTGSANLLVYPCNFIDTFATIFYITFSTHRILLFTL